MPFFVVDLEFREKARQLITTKEVGLCIIVCLLALVSWNSIFEYLQDFVSLGKRTAAYTSLHDQLSSDTMDDPHCNPKFPKLCPQAEENL